MASTATTLKGTTSTGTASTEAYAAASGSGLGLSSLTTVTTRQRTRMRLRPTGTTAQATGRTTRAWRVARRRGCRYRLHDASPERGRSVAALISERRSAPAPRARHVSPRLRDADVTPPLFASLRDRDGKNPKVAPCCNRPALSAV